MATLSRYTSALAVLDTLRRQRITLLKPATWIDQNDRELMDRYARTVPNHGVFAYCMAEGKETAHHWQVFAGNGGGACIKFDQTRLLEAISKSPGLRHGSVSYVSWRDLKILHHVPSEIPFIKRSVFRFEKEYRLVAAVPELEHEKALHIPIPLDCVTSVYISGEVPVPLFETIVDLIREIPGCRSLRVKHSGLLRNINWSSSLNMLP